MASLTAWVTLNFSGAMIHGQRRLGKSHCAEFIKRYLSDTIGYRISVTLLCVRKHDAVREGDFLDSLLRALGEAPPTRGSKDQKMELIINRFLIMARRCPARKVVLVLDDAQRLEILHFEILMSIQNELYHLYRVMLFTLLVGQPQIKVKRELLIVSGEKQITARLMADDVEFVGHRSLDEVRFAYNRFDQHCFHPARSGISFTQGLAPEAWAADWRLANEAEPIWNEYVGRREEMGVEPVEEASMQALTTMATYIYQKYANQAGFRGLSPDQVTDVVLAAGLLQLETRAREDASGSEGDSGEEPEDD
ncbi:ATP-binding protein [Luteimonas marina]|uniref:ATP-binding protein n=1 Tax=Luteimonas marina TaxID=488485 RepID=A0A5C5UDK8_9GAMM|nr:ATP-binding protein [Luteimonas marina]TWT23620.1 ATP-binding protein [Luteimonas marina]